MGCLVLYSNGTDQQIAGKGSGVDSTQGNTQGQGPSGLLCVDEVRTESTHKALGAHCVRNEVLPDKEYAGQVAGLNKQEYCSAPTIVNDQLSKIQARSGDKTEDAAQTVKGAMQAVWVKDIADGEGLCA